MKGKKGAAQAQSWELRYHNQLHVISTADKNCYCPCYHTSYPDCSVPLAIASVAPGNSCNTVLSGSTAPGLTFESAIHYSSAATRARRLMSSTIGPYSTSTYRSPPSLQVCQVASLLTLHVLISSLQHKLTRHSYNSCSHFFSSHGRYFCGPAVELEGGSCK